MQSAQILTNQDERVCITLMQYTLRVKTTMAAMEMMQFAIAKECSGYHQTDNHNSCKRRMWGLETHLYMYNFNHFH